ncbi:MAG TPA: alpha-glucan family phosphorylase, partial [Bacteroidales bacterium]|nr:alpha-glucan family phosphorylase [Bacteroidales bacterium]
MALKDKPLLVPDYLLETSWEVCNKIGGIYTAIATKANLLAEELKDNYILIGPDVWKETHQNPEFIEDKFLFKSWREAATAEGLRIKVGRWNIPGKPAVILIDFTPYFPEKDKIFAHFWEHYKLDSLSGDWDYVEPALFGYAAGKVIESFYNFNISYHDKIVAQFHDWVTGTGILYLKEYLPQVGTVFTAHATVVGRTIAANGLPLYKNLENYGAEAIARQFGVAAKYSLERLTAHEADYFTTQSQVVNNECRQFLEKEADRLTPNGFDDSWVPSKEVFNQKRSDARKKLIEVAGALTGTTFKKDTIFLLSSGRSELRNKGHLLFIDALARLNAQSKLTQDIVAVVAVPAVQTIPKKDLAERLNSGNYGQPRPDEYCTHTLDEPENDAILQRIKSVGLKNRPEDRVKVVYAPTYLNGSDGIFNLNYYDLLIGFDGTVFPSYYEPWGYSALESLSFHIPTITTSVSGFGHWIRSLYPSLKDCTAVIDRNDDNDDQVIDDIVRHILSCSSKSEQEIIRSRIKAYEISRTALWKNLIINFREAYSETLEITASRAELYAGKQPLLSAPVPRCAIERPDWRKVLVQPHLPENLEGLERLAKNLWWSWNFEGSELFEMISKQRWYELKFNPIALIESLSFNELQDLSANEKFVTKLAKVTAAFDAYMAKASHKPKEQVAYFSMEYGLHDTLKIFSGGLGMLAGDYLKEASDSNCNIVGVGLLYRYGYFTQSLSVYGDQIASYTPQKFTHLPLVPVRDGKGNWLKVTFALPGRTVYAKIWCCDVGRIPLYLMDTDIEENDEADRSITHQLYGGDLENRLRQEMLLGIGGIRMLELLGINPELYHSNEGHSAFIGLERLKNLIQREKLTLAQAIEVVRSSTLFTTHTPVPAGHDTFTEDLLRRYLSHYPEQLGLKWEQFMNLGRMVDFDVTEKFSMSVLAAKLSQDINGVSRIHGRVTREMFAKLYAGYYPDELHIGYVTNGVHLPTWTAKSWQQLYRKEFGEGFVKDQSDPRNWKAIHKVADETIWNLRMKQKAQMTDYLLQHLRSDMTHRHENPKLLFKIREASNPKALTIGFARRFATYKRAHLLFSNLDRLARIVNNKERPVQFLFAGKAHPNDKGGQELIRKIYEISHMPEFLGKVF